MRTPDDPPPRKNRTSQIKELSKTRHVEEEETKDYKIMEEDRKNEEEYDPQQPIPTQAELYQQHHIEEEQTE